MMFKSFNKDNFAAYINGVKLNRSITKVQLHHTWSPSYKHFNGNNHQTLQQNMKNYHVNTNGWADIAQHFTIFPDGLILTGRSLEKSPAGIKGANTGAICIECIGNFDIGGDTMTDAQKNAIVAVVKALLTRFKLKAETAVIYHCWFTSGGTNLGDYIKGRSAKTCPGTNFFGGNTKAAFNKNLLPLLKGANTVKKLETGNDIVWELMNGKHKIEIQEVDRAVKALDKAKTNTEFCSLYWILYKLVNGNG